MRKLGKLAILFSGTALTLQAGPAVADDYTDLLSVLRDRGTLSQTEYQTLSGRHSSRAAAPAAVRDRAATGRRGGNRGSSAPPSFDERVATQADESARAAAASAASAQAAMESTKAAMQSPEIVRAMPYTPGKGITVRAGAVDLNFSGFVNGFYTYTSADRGGPNRMVAGGLADAGGFDSSAVRSGLLPAALIFKASTTQAGIDLAAVFGVYPGINTSKAGALGANSGGNPVGLGTNGVDFRQVYVTAGTKEAGTVKFGRDIGIFGSDAILSDATLLGVGATGGNTQPGNTSLGRIGIGYIYADFLPQITYASPIMAGVQVTLGAFQPMDEFNFSGNSGSSAAHDTPMFQGKVTYDFKRDTTAVRLWSSFLVQPQQGITTTSSLGVTGTGRNRLVAAGDIGAKVDVGPFGVVASGYRGDGVGTTALFFDGIDQRGRTRGSDGYYVQGTWKPVPKLKLAASYGQSNLYTSGTEVSPLLVRRNESEVAGAYYSLTDWLTLVGEYAHVTAKAQNGNRTRENSFTAGGIVFF